MAKFRDHRDIKWPGAWLIEQELISGVPDIPSNRTLYIQQLTDKAPAEPEFVDDCETLQDVFHKFEPGKTINLEDENGIPVEETFAFRSLMDFGKDGIVQQSDLLKSLEEKKITYADFIKRLRTIKLLQKLLSDPETKAAYIEALDSFVEELDAADPE